MSDSFPDVDAQSADASGDAFDEPTPEQADQASEAAAPVVVDGPSDESGAASETPSQPVVFRVMNVESVLYDLGESTPSIHLVEAEAPYRYVPVPIALPEAVALHNALGSIDGRRPGTHELLSAMLKRLQCDVIVARVVRYESGVFYAELDVMTPRGRETFDCRTSDAIIVALRQTVPSPVLCAEEVIAAFYV